MSKDISDIWGDGEEADSTEMYDDVAMEAARDDYYKSEGRPLEEDEVRLETEKKIYLRSQRFDNLSPTDEAGW